MTRKHQWSYDCVVEGDRLPFTKWVCRVCGEVAAFYSTPEKSQPDPSGCPGYRDAEPRVVIKEEGE